MKAPSVALVFPPVWYYTAVPVDLSQTAGCLRAAGVDVTVRDLNAALHAEWFGEAAAPLRDKRTYEDTTTHAVTTAGMQVICAEISSRYKVRYTLRQLSFPELDLEDCVAARDMGLDSGRNPAFSLLAREAQALVDGQHRLIAIALVHPDQAPHALALAALLREAGFGGHVVLYGAMEDVLSPLDFAPDLANRPEHALWRDIDGLVLGEGGPGLLGLVRALSAGGELTGLPRWMGRGAGLPAESAALALNSLASPDFSGLSSPLTPTPVVDLRLSRGCPWARCAFCAIQAHHGYAAAPADQVVAAMARAHAQTGATFFRLRDDLLTPTQLTALARATAKLPFRPRWSARARIEPTLTRRVLDEAMAGGLQELWVGLESASARVRALMDKGVRDEVVESLLREAPAAGLRLRLLCLVGFPGETLAEAASTLRLLKDHAGALAGFSVTPFQLMRRSPMAQDPGRFGLRLIEDTRAEDRRMRWRLPFTGPVLDAATIGTLMRRVNSDLVPLLPPILGPDLHHDWMSASARQRGW